AVQHHVPAPGRVRPCAAGTKAEDILALELQLPAASGRDFALAEGADQQIGLTASAARESRAAVEDMEGVNLFGGRRQSHIRAIEVEAEIATIVMQNIVAEDFAEVGGLDLVLEEGEIDIILPIDMDGVQIMLVGQPRIRPIK